MKRANVRELGPNLEAAEMPPGGRQKISAVVDNIGRNQCTATTEEHAGVHQLALTTIERTVSDYAQVLFLREREIKDFPGALNFRRKDLGLPPSPPVWLEYLSSRCRTTTTCFASFVRQMECFEDACNTSPIASTSTGSRDRKLTVSMAPYALLQQAELPRDSSVFASIPATKEEEERQALAMWLPLSVRSCSSFQHAHGVVDAHASRAGASGRRGPVGVSYGCQRVYREPNNKLSYRNAICKSRWAQQHL